PPRLAVPALGHLRPRGAEAERDAPAREQVERGHGHRRRGGAARRHLHDRRAEADPLGARADPGERRDRVGAPGLRGPHAVEAEPVRLLRERQRRDRVVVPELQAEAHRAILLRVTGALFPAELLELRARYRAFMEEHVYPAEAALDREDDAAQELVGELQERARRAGLWAPHMPPEAGGSGRGFLAYACVNEEIGRCVWAQLVFGCQAPDAGNAEILHLYATPEQRERFLRPLVAGEVRSFFS